MPFLIPPITIPPHVYAAIMTGCRMAIPVVAGGGGAAALSMVLVRSLIRSLWDNFLPDWIRRGDDGSGGDDDGSCNGGSAD